MGCVLNWDGDWQEEISRMISRFLSHAQGHMVVPFTGQEKPEEDQTLRDGSGVLVWTA